MFWRLQCHLPACSHARGLGGMAKLCSPSLAWSWALSKWRLFCVPEICPDIPLQVPAGLSTGQDLGPGGVPCPSLALCGQSRAH